MSNYDWTKFEKQVFIQASPMEVCEAWAIPDEIVTWFVGQADYTLPNGELRAGADCVQPGDTYYWRWLQGSDIRGRILALEPGRLFQFTFGQQPDPDDDIVVTVRFEETSDGDTLVTVTQENIADTPEAHVTWHMSCNLGWSFFITNLKAVMEHGVDLREKDVERAHQSRAVSLTA